MMSIYGCIMSKLCLLIKILKALKEYHQPTHSAYRNKQIIQACLARM